MHWNEIVYGTASGLGGQYLVAAFAQASDFFATALEQSVIGALSTEPGMLLFGIVMGGAFDYLAEKGFWPNLEA